MGEMGEQEQFMSNLQLKVKEQISTKIRDINEWNEDINTKKIIKNAVFDRMMLGINHVMKDTLTGFQNKKGIDFREYPGAAPEYYWSNWFEGNENQEGLKEWP
jgi:hypothetical protein